MLLGHTDIGMDLAPRLNGRLGGGLAMDCLSLSIDPATKFLVTTRPVYGGNAYATAMSSRHDLRWRHQTETVPAAERNDSRQGQVIVIEDKVDPAMVKIKVIERIKEQVEGVKLEDAEVVVSGGRGIGSKQNFEMVKELARVLGGAVGATRPVCDEGWTPASLQVGQSGKVSVRNLHCSRGLRRDGAHHRLPGLEVHSGNQ